MRFDELSTPSYIVQEEKIKSNLNILKNVQEKAGCKILLAQKAFSMYRLYPLISVYLSGYTASGLFEAKLAAEEMGKSAENHVFEPAYKPSEMEEILKICDHVYFNSIAQLEKHREAWERYEKEGKVKIALRINPEHSTQVGHEIYDPCGKGSRLGIRRIDFPEELPKGVTGLHFHTLCEQGLEPLKETFAAVEERFGKYLKQISFINLGGGHHITKDDYDVEGLIAFIKEIKAKYGFEVYLEPGEAIALNAGTLITEVLDVVRTGDYITAIVDASAACHMPDVLEMPYTPPLLDATEDTGFLVRIASRTCLAGDVIGTYVMPRIPEVGDILTFGDMAIYSMVKNNTFNGMALPDIVLEHADGDFELVKRFSYEDFKLRLS